MPIKILSNQVYTERYDYTMAADENIFLPIKAMPGEVLIIHSISVYNSSANKYGNMFKVMKRRGVLMRLDYLKELDDPGVKLFDQDIYLVDGDECGIALTPNAANDTVQVTFNCIRLIDADSENNQ